MEIFDFCILNIIYFYACYFILSRQARKIYSFCFLGNRNCRIYPDNVFKPPSGTNGCPCRSIHRITFKNNCKFHYLDNYHFGSFAVCKISTEYLQKVMLTSSLIILGMQCVGYISLFPSADKSAFTYYSDKDELILDGSKQFTVSSNDNIILFILDNFSSTYLASAVEKYPDLKDFLHDFTYYNNADCNYHGTYPSLPHLLTGNDLDPSLSVDDWLEDCWTNTTTNDYFSILSDANYKVNLYTPTTSILTGNHSLPLLDGKISNITTKQSSICIDYHKLYKTMFYMSCYRFMPEYFKSFFDVSMKHIPLLYLIRKTIFYIRTMIFIIIS